MYTSRLGRVSLVLALVVVGSLAFLSRPAVVSASQAIVAIEPAELVVEPGATFTIDVAVRDVSDLGAYEFRMRFDPAVVRVTNAEDGGFLEGSLVIVGPDIDNQSGTLDFGALAVGAAQGAAGSGTLATLTLEAVGEGVIPLSVQDVLLVSNAGEELSVTLEGGRVMVGTGPMPTQVPSPTPTDAPDDPDEPTPVEPAEPTETDAPTVPPDATATAVAETATAPPDEQVTGTPLPPASPDPTDAETPTPTGETETPPIETTPTTEPDGEAPAPTESPDDEEPAPVSPNRWLIPAAVVLGLLGAALTAAGIFLSGPSGDEKDGPSDE